jgi:hypothetical protein
MSWSVALPEIFFFFLSTDDNSAQTKTDMTPATLGRSIGLQLPGVIFKSLVPDFETHSHQRDWQLIKQNPVIADISF